jgi:hypothetical protein
VAPGRTGKLRSGFEEGGFMRTITCEELKKILGDRGLWIKGNGGERANLHEADLHGATLDFSSIPLSCGGLNWKIDRRIAVQIAYHFCSMECDDSDFLKLRNGMLNFVNQFHRVDECGKLLPEKEEAAKETDGKIEQTDDRGAALNN